MYAPGQITYDETSLRTGCTGYLPVNVNVEFNPLYTELLENGYYQLQQIYDTETTEELWRPVRVDNEADADFVVNVGLSGTGVTLKSNTTLTENGRYLLGDYDGNPDDVEMEIDETETTNRSVILNKNAKTLVLTRDVDAETDTSSSYEMGTFTVNVTPTLQTKTITSNGSYTPDTGYDGFSGVTVNVPSESCSLQTKTVNSNGTYTPDSGYDGFSEFTVDVVHPLQDKTVTSNGVVTCDAGYYGLGNVTVNVPSSVVSDPINIETICGVPVSSFYEVSPETGECTGYEGTNPGCDVIIFMVTTNRIFIKRFAYKSEISLPEGEGIEFCLENDVSNPYSFYAHFFSSSQQNNLNENLSNTIPYIYFTYTKNNQTYTIYLPNTTSNYSPTITRETYDSENLVVNLKFYEPSSSAVGDLPLSAFSINRSN